MSGWWSQPFPPEGSTASEGIRKQLGLPTLDPLDVMLRETAQNAWDARSTEAGPIRLHYGVDTLGNTRSAAFQKWLLPGPTGDPQLADFASHLAPESPLLVVSDRRTAGLGGPLRSDEPRTAESPDFVNFVRNAGEPRDRQLGGGTFGFGKGALFRVSRPGVVLIDTLCVFRGAPQRRLIGAALGHSHEQAGRRHTGRHWWGDIVGGVPDPLLDSEADGVGAELGLRGFSGEPGTDIYVIGADLGEAVEGRSRTVAEAAERLAGAAAWNLWPKLIDRGSGPFVQLDIAAGDVAVPVPDPERSGRLRCFVAALRKLDEGGGTAHTRATTPVRLGDFASTTDVWVERSERVLDLAQPFEGRSHHCARMRHVELVVDYYPGDAPVDPAVQFGAVYRASVEADDYFAEAEPPTHHDWVTQHLVSTSKGVVTAAKRFVREQMHLIAEPPTAATAASTAPLGQLSSALARILPAAAGDGAGSGAGGGGGGGGGGGTSLVRSVGDPTFALRSGEAVIAQRVRFEVSSRQITASVAAHVGVDGGREKSAPVGAPSPEIVGWESPAGELRPGASLTVGSTEERSWTVLVRPAADASTIVQVSEVKP